MYPAPRTPHPTRRGFTLVEILVTITILGMMASMLLLAVQAANNSAKVAKTKATIAKINHFVMLRYDSYRTRRPESLDQQSRRDVDSPVGARAGQRNPGFDADGNA